MKSHTADSRVSFASAAMAATASALIGAFIVALVIKSTLEFADPPFPPPPTSEVSVKDDSPTQPVVITDVKSEPVEGLELIRSHDLLRSGSLAWTRDDKGSVLRHSDLHDLVDGEDSDFEVTCKNDFEVLEATDFHHARGATLLWYHWTDGTNHRFGADAVHDAGPVGQQTLFVGDPVADGSDAIQVPIWSRFKPASAAGRFAFESALSTSDTGPQGLVSRVYVSWQDYSGQQGVYADISAEKIDELSTKVKSIGGFDYSAAAWIEVPAACEPGTDLSITVVCWASKRSTSTADYELRDLKLITTNYYVDRP